MKSDSPLSKLPSLEELISHPAVAGVVKRVNQTTLAQRATGFLDDLRSGLQQRLEQKGVSSLGQLAERFARHLIGPPDSICTCVNATGAVLGDAWSGVPLAESAIDEMMRLSSEYYHAEEDLDQRACQLLCDLTKSRCAAIFVDCPRAQQFLGKPEDSSAISRFAGLLSPAEYGLSDLPTINHHLEEAPSLVVEGAGLLGGPTCGIVLARDSSVKMPEVSTQGRGVSHLTLVALLATLKIHRQDEHVIHKLPVWQLLSAPLDNLRQRAERLAALMQESPRVQTATPIRLESTWCDTAQSKLTGPSWGIEVLATEDAHESLVANLSQEIPRILAQVQQNRILFDLRSVFPRWDHTLLKSVS